MTELLLIDELVKRLRELFRGYTLLNKSGILQEVKIFAQYLPQPSGISIMDKELKGVNNYVSEDYDNNFPCVIVKIDDVMDKEEGNADMSECGVKLLCGIYDEAAESQGYRDVMNMQERIRENLLNDRVIGGRYLLKMPMYTKLLNDDTWPVYFGEQKLIYEIGRPRMQEYIYHARRVH